MTARAVPTQLLLAYDYPPMGGGISRMLGEIARQAPPARWRVSTGRVAGDSEADRNSPARVDRSAGAAESLRTLPGLVRWAWCAGRLAQRDGVGFCWAGNLKPAGHVAWWLRRRRRIPYGLLVYGLDVALLGAQAADSAIRRGAARRIIREAAVTVAISDWTAERARELAGALGCPAAGDRVRVVYPGVDHGRFRPGLLTGEQRTRLDLGARSWLLTVARLVPHKGVDVALAVLAALRARGIDAGYLVAGDGPARAALERRAAGLGLAECVRFLGPVPDAELPALYCAAEVYLGLSREEGPEVEGFGLSLLEAAASGLPVVAGRSGGAPEAVLHGQTGVLVPPRDEAAVVAALESLLRDPDRARALGAAGRARVVRDFGWARVVDQLERLAAEVSAAPGAPGGR